MRAFIVALTCCMVVTPAIAAAQSSEAEALRRELQELRRQQEQSQKTIDALSERLKRLESPPAAVGQAPANPSTQTGPVSPSDLLRP